MKFSKIASFALFLVLFLVLIRNFQYLYVAPIQNAYWWSSDETWLMSEYHSFLTTAHYINPTAPGSAYAQATGVLFGSCYLTALLYGLPALILKFPIIDIGRTVTFSIGLFTLFTLWFFAKRYRAPTWLALFGCVLLASTLCFFVMSHTVRYDLLVGFAVLVFVALLPLVREQRSGLSIAFGLTLPFCLLLNGHLLIYLTLALAYFAFLTKPRWNIFIGSMIAGFVALFGIQFLLLHSTSFFGPLQKSGISKIPLQTIFHPKSDYWNLYWRIFIANMWARNILFLVVAILVVLTILRFRYKINIVHWATLAEKRLAIGAALVLFASLFLEDVLTPRYFIHVLPTIVFLLTIVLWVMYRIPSRKFLIVPVVIIIAVFSVWDYVSATDTMGSVGETISRENEHVMRSALAVIHTRSNNKVPRVFCTVAGQAIAMDDDSIVLFTTVMYNQPAAKVPDSTIWNRAKIDYAIKYSGNYKEVNSYIDTTSHPNIIFERTGHFADFARSYDAAGLMQIDTLRVYEFRR